jgi:hypothetical protein
MLFQNNQHLKLKSSQLLWNNITSTVLFLGLISSICYLISFQTNIDMEQPPIWAEDQHVFSGSQRTSVYICMGQKIEQFH